MVGVKGYVNDDIRNSCRKGMQENMMASVGYIDERRKKEVVKAGGEGLTKRRGRRGV